MRVRLIKAFQRLFYYRLFFLGDNEKCCAIFSYSNHTTAWELAASLFIPCRGVNMCAQHLGGPLVSQEISLHLCVFYIHVTKWGVCVHVFACMHTKMFGYWNRGLNSQSSVVILVLCWCEEGNATLQSWGEGAHDRLPPSDPQHHLHLPHPCQSLVGW